MSYSFGELETVKRAILEGVDEAEYISRADVEYIDVCNSSYTNVKVTIKLSGSVCITFDDLSKIADKVKHTNLASTFTIDGKPFPLDFRFYAEADKTWLELWF